MKREFLKVCLLMGLILMSFEIYSSVPEETESYMEYQDIQTEAKVYEDQASKDASITEFSLQDKMQIAEANAMLADSDL